MAYRVSVTGIDGAGKSSSISDLAANLSEDYVVAKVGRPVYVEQKGERRYVFQKTTGTIDKSHSLFDNSSYKPGILLVNSVNVSIQPLLEKSLIRKFSPDILIASRDMAICPAVYLTYYLPISRKISTELRLKMFSSFRKLGYPDQVFYLDVDPKEADQRISGRIAAEREASPAKRPKWRHLHETVDDLTELRKYYLEALDILEGKVNITRISTTNCPRSEVVNSMETTLKAQLRSSAPNKRQVPSPVAVRITN